MVVIHHRFINSLINVIYWWFFYHRNARRFSLQIYITSVSVSFTSSLYVNGWKSTTSSSLPKLRLLILWGNCTDRLLRRGCEQDSYWTYEPDELDESKHSSRLSVKLQFMLLMSSSDSVLPACCSHEQNVAKLGLVLLLLTVTIELFSTLIFFRNSGSSTNSCSSDVFDILFKHFQKIIELRTLYIKHVIHMTYVPKNANIISINCNLQLIDDTNGITYSIRLGSSKLTTFSQI